MNIHFTTNNLAGQMIRSQNCQIMSLHKPGPDMWLLKVTDTQVEDTGEYECQLSYHEDREKQLKQTFELNVLGE